MSNANQFVCMGYHTNSQALRYLQMIDFSDRPSQDPKGGDPEGEIPKGQGQMNKNMKCSINKNKNKNKNKTVGPCFLKIRGVTTPENQGRYNS